MIREELWDFPHSMQLKVMGAADAPLEEAVVAILETHLDDFDRHAHLSSKPSTKGNFVSLTASVVLRDRDQVEAIYRELNACPHVKITL
ncbi:YbeD family protein [Alloalcanivorax sp. C16-2]|uniref:YbeD family protein n=1 Tax=Alloalcanivorax sp. C16-2 TaxID=3390052 RepID=UPI003970C4F3